MSRNIKPKSQVSAVPPDAVWLKPLVADLPILNTHDRGAIMATFYDGVMVNGVCYFAGDVVVVSPGEDEQQSRSLHALEVLKRFPMANPNWYVWQQTRSKSSICFNVMVKQIC